MTPVVCAQTIFDMSKDSPHFQNEARKQAQVDAKVLSLKQQAARVSPAKMTHHEG